MNAPTALSAALSFIHPEAQRRQHNLVLVCNFSRFARRYDLALALFPGLNATSVPISSLDISLNLVIPVTFPCLGAFAVQPLPWRLRSSRRSCAQFCVLMPSGTFSGVTPTLLLAQLTSLTSLKPPIPHTPLAPPILSPRSPYTRTHPPATLLLAMP